MKKLPKKPDLVPLTTGDKKPRGWYLYQTQAVCIANSRGVAKGVTEPKKPTTTQVTGYVVTDPHFVDYNPPPEEMKVTDYLKFGNNPFELKGPEFIESSSVEEPAYNVCDPDVLNRRKV